MRPILGITLLVVGLGMVLCNWEDEDARPSVAVEKARWVRTIDGWERAGSWHAVVIRPPGLHPVVLAAGQGLVSVFALVAFGKEGAGEGEQGAG